MSELGFSGEQRYLLGVAALLAVAGGVVAARAVAAGRVPALAAAGLLVAPLPFAVPAAVEAGRDLGYAAELRGGLDSAVDRAGGAERLRECGPLSTGRYRFPLVAWHVRSHISALALRPGRRGVAFRSRLTPRAPVEPDAPVGYRRLARANGWEVLGACT